MCLFSSFLLFVCLFIGFCFFFSEKEAALKHHRTSIFGDQSEGFCCELAAQQQPVDDVTWETTALLQPHPACSLKNGPVFLFFNDLETFIQWRCCALEQLVAADLNFYCKPDGTSTFKNSVNKASLCTPYVRKATWKIQFTTSRLLTVGDEEGDFTLQAAPFSPPTKKRVTAFKWQTAGSR